MSSERSLRETRQPAHTLDLATSSSKPVGPLELEPLFIPQSQLPQPVPLQASDLPSLLTDLAIRYTPSETNDGDSGLDEILLPLLQRWGSILLHNKLDIGGGGNLANTNGIGWRDILLALQNLTEVKPIAKLMPELRGWNPLRESERGAVEVKAEEFEYRALWGPWLRLSSFPDGAVSLFFIFCTRTRAFKLDLTLSPVSSAIAGIAASLFPRPDLDGSRQHPVSVHQLERNARGTSSVFKLPRYTSESD